jgi:hypothetical protein
MPINIYATTDLFDALTFMGITESSDSQECDWGEVHKILYDKIMDVAQTSKVPELIWGAINGTFGLTTERKSCEQLSEQLQCSRQNIYAARQRAIERLRKEPDIIKLQDCLS